MIHLVYTTGFEPLWSSFSSSEHQLIYSMVDGVVRLFKNAPIKTFTQHKVRNIYTGQYENKNYWNHAVWRFRKLNHHYRSHGHRLKYTEAAEGKMELRMNRWGSGVTSSNDMWQEVMIHLPGTPGCMYSIVLFFSYWLVILCFYTIWRLHPHGIN